MDDDTEEETARGVLVFLVEFGGDSPKKAGVVLWLLRLLLFWACWTEFKINSVSCSISALGTSMKRVEVDKLNREPRCCCCCCWEETVGIVRCFPCSGGDCRRYLIPTKTAQPRSISIEETEGKGTRLQAILPNTNINIMLLILYHVAEFFSKRHRLVRAYLKIQSCIFRRELLACERRQRNFSFACTERFFFQNSKNSNHDT